MNSKDSVISSNGKLGLSVLGFGSKGGSARTGQCEMLCKSCRNQQILMRWSSNSAGEYSLSKQEGSRFGELESVRRCLQSFREAHT